MFLIIILVGHVYCPTVDLPEILQCEVRLLIFSLPPLVVKLEGIVYAVCVSQFEHAV